MMSIGDIVAIGRVASGTLKQGAKVVIMPSGRQSRAASIEVYHGNRSQVLPGDLIGVRLADVSLSDVHRGMVVCDPSAQSAISKPSHTFIAQIVILSHPGAIRAGYKPMLFCHTATFPCRFAQLLAKVDRLTGQVVEETPQSVHTGEAVLVRMEATKPVYVEPFSTFAPLGRFVVRDLHLTVAVGIIKEVVDVPNVIKKTSSSSSSSSKRSKFFG